MTPEETSILMEMASKVGRIEQSVADLSKQLLDNGQPGFLTRTRLRLEDLERTDLRRTWIERVITVALASIFSIFISLHDHFGLK